MFIAPSAIQRSRSVRSETRQQNLRRVAKAIALLRSFGVKKGPSGYKHLSPHWGEDLCASVVNAFEVISPQGHRASQSFTKNPLSPTDS